MTARSAVTGGGDATGAATNLPSPGSVVKVAYHCHPLRYETAMTPERCSTTAPVSSIATSSG